MTCAPGPMVAIKRGLAVFAIPPGGRRPAGPGWQRNVLRTAADLRSWQAGDNIGIGCWANQLLVLDLDVADGAHGPSTFAASCARAGRPWPATFTVRTPSGGMHLYFTPPGGVVIGSTSGGMTRLGPGIDTRGPGAGGRGGYVVGPTSIVGGRRYEITHDVAIADLPTWLAHLLRPDTFRRAPRRTP